LAVAWCVDADVDPGLCALSARIGIARGVFRPWLAVILLSEVRRWCHVELLTQVSGQSQHTQSVHSGRCNTKHDLLSAVGLSRPQAG